MTLLRGKHYDFAANRCENETFYCREAHEPPLQILTDKSEALDCFHGGTI